MSMIPIQPKVYDDGRTVQSAKDETDINKLLSRAQRAGTLSHLQKYEGTYSDFSDFDFFEAQQRLAQGREIFDELPAELRREFGNSPADFFRYVNEPENQDKLRELLPALAKPGTQRIDLSGKTPPPQKTPPGVASEPPASENKPTNTPPVGNTPPPAEGE